jgi:hypothetical protein
MHQTGAQTKTPQRGSAQLVLRLQELEGRKIAPSLRREGASVMLGDSHDDAVAGAHIVEQEIAVGMNRLAAEGRGNRQRAAVNHRAFGRGGKRGNVAKGAADLVEELFAELGTGSLRGQGVASGSLRCANEAGELIDVLEAIGAGKVVGLADGVAEHGDFGWKQHVGDSEFVQVGVAGKGEQARVLVLPAKFADRAPAGSFEDWNVEHLAADFALARLALAAREIEKSLIGDGFDESVTEKIEGDAKRADVFGIRHTLLNLVVRKSGVRTDGAIVDEGTAFDDLGSIRDGDFRILKVAARIEMSHAQFRHLALAARSGILVALATGLRVVKRPETFGYLQDGFKGRLVARVSRLIDESVGLVVESSRRFGGLRKDGENEEKKQSRAEEEFHWAPPS